MKALAPEQKVLSYVKAFFDYHPYDDSLCPCPEAGLAFQYGDILAIVNQDDPNWWQVRIYIPPWCQTCVQGRNTNEDEFLFPRENFHFPRS